MLGCARNSERSGLREVFTVKSTAPEILPMNALGRKEAQR
jgi:hypothetical protein